VVDVFKLIGAGSTLSLVGLCVALARLSWQQSKRIRSNNNDNCQNNSAYVQETEFQTTVKNIDQRIESLERHLSQRFDDLNTRIDDLVALVRNGRK